MVIIQVIVSLLICAIVPTLVGDLLLPNEAFVKQYIMGILGSLAIAQVLFLPFIIFQHPFTPYYIAYIIIIIVLCTYSVFLRHKGYTDRFISILSVKDRFGTINLWMILALLMICTQVVRVAVGHFFVYADNSFYIPIINDLIETDFDCYLDFKTGMPGSKESNVKYLFTSYFPYLASICKASGLHPAILVQTILPIVFTISLYGLIWNYGLLLFKHKQSVWMFVFFFSVLVETIGGYDFTYANHAVSGIYFGKKIVFTILLPYIMLFIVEKTSLLEDKVTNMNIKELLLLLVMMTGVCAPSLMGTGLAPIILFSMGLVLTIRRKSLIPLAQMGVAVIPSFVFLIMAISYLYL